MEKKPTYVELPEGLTEEKFLKMCIRLKKIERGELLERIRVAASNRHDLERHIAQNERYISQYQGYIRTDKKRLEKLSRLPQNTNTLDTEIRQLEERLATITGKPVKKSSRKSDPDSNY